MGIHIVFVEDVVKYVDDMDDVDDVDKMENESFFNLW